MEPTEFMTRLSKRLMEERKVSETTATAYLRTLYVLNEKKPFKDLKFLKKTDDISAKIATYAESTQRAILATLSSVLSLFKDSFKKAYQFFYDKMMERSKAAAAAPEHVMTPKQKENWLSWDAVKARKEELESAIGKLKKKINATEYDTLLQFVLLSLYTDILPRRNLDFLRMKVVKQLTDKHPMTENYYDLSKQTFTFNKFKTSKTYGSQTVPVPPELQRVLSIYLARHPVWKATNKRKKDAEAWLLVDYEGKHLEAVNAITRILNRIFGKRIGSSMLRHIYISHALGGAIDATKTAADAMGHSVAVQRAYYKKEAPLVNEVVLDAAPVASEKPIPT